MEEREKIKQAFIDGRMIDFSGVDEEASENSLWVCDACHGSGKEKCEVRAGAKPCKVCHGYGNTTIPNSFKVTEVKNEASDFYGMFYITCRFVIAGKNPNAHHDLLYFHSSNCGYEWLSREDRDADCSYFYEEECQKILEQIS
ncbi:hypothetical protein KC851_01235 [Candidatus Kaiserbacteria bacterium]|nr:hypothetical protein [Candidatus Kaiserbacteria bacterium]